MRVMIVHPQMALYGGAEVVVVHLANYLREQGHKAAIATLSTADRPEYANLQFILPESESDYVRYRLRDGSIDMLRDIYKMFSNLKRLCNTYAKHFDVINAHNFPAAWAVPSNRKVVWMCNEVPDLWHSAKVTGLKNRLFDVGRLGDRILVNRKNIKAVVPDNRSARIFYLRYKFSPDVIPYGIDGDFFARTQNVVTPRKFTIIVPSMISPSKNQLDVLKAVNKDVKVIFAGYCETLHPYTQQLRRYVDFNNLDVSFTGHITKEDLRVLYHSSHVAVFSGKGQGSWLGPFEALSTGIPTIVSPNLTCSELILKHNLGLVDHSLGKALNEVHDNYLECKQQALRGQKFVLENLTWDNFGKSFTSLLEEARET